MNDSHKAWSPDYIYEKAMRTHETQYLGPIQILELVEPDEVPLVDWVQIPFLFIALVGLVGNSLILWLLGFQIRRNPFSVYIFNLAGADALFLCCTFVMSPMKLVVSYLYNSDLYFILDVFRGIAYTVSLSLLATISSERCLAVLFPIWYRCHRPKHTSTVMCTVHWAVAGLLWLLYYLLCIWRHFGNSCDADTVVLFVWFLLLSFVLCVSSLTLLLRVQCSSQRQQPPRLYLLVLLNVLVFLLCGLPMGICSFILRFHKASILLWLPQLLACVNSSANPFIYFFLGRQRHRKGKESLKVVLQRTLADEQELGNEERGTPHTMTPETSS